MTQLPVDYAGLVPGLRMQLTPADLGAALLDAVAERYENQFPDSSLLQFVQSGATYLFDLASAVGAEQENRTFPRTRRNPRLRPCTSSKTKYGHLTIMVARIHPAIARHGRYVLSCRVGRVRSCEIQPATPPAFARRIDAHLGGQ